MKIRNIFMYGMAIFCLFLITTTTATGQEIVKDVEITAEQADIKLAEMTPGSYFVEIGGPDNYYHKERVNFTNEISFSNIGQNGEQFKDGSYSLQITPIFELTQQQRDDLTALRNNNDQEGMAAYRFANNLPAEVDQFNMNFRIINGQFAISSQTEGEINLPTMSSQWEMDHPSLYASVNTVGLDYQDHAMDNSSTNVDQVFIDDVIIDGSLCVGQDCVNGENFGFDTQRLKENNLRIHFNDTSASASFPSNDWRITINDSSNGGANYFAVEDATAGRVPFRIEAGAPVNSLYVEDDGDIGVGTNTPVVEVHVRDGDSPTLRLEQDGSSGFQSQTWDLAGNETNFFIRDVTNGSSLPFRIRPGAPQSSIDIMADGGLQFVRYGDGNETGTPTFLLGVDMNGNVIEQPIGSGSVTGSGAANQVAYWDGTSSLTGDADFTFDGTGINVQQSTATSSTLLALKNTSGNAVGEFTVGSSGRGNFFLNDSDGTTQIFEVSAGEMFYDGGNVAIGKNNASGNTHKLEVCGSIGATSATLNTITCSSDERFKKNISPLQNSLEKVLNLQGVNYNWRQDEFPDRMFEAGEQIGFIAQEMEEVLPELVVTEKDGYKSVEYSHLTPVLVEAIKEQQQIIDAQKEEINTLKSQVASLEELKAQVAALTQMVMNQSGSADSNKEVGEE